MAFIELIISPFLLTDYDKQMLCIPKIIINFGLKPFHPLFGRCTESIQFFGTPFLLVLYLYLVNELKSCNKIDFFHQNKQNDAGENLCLPKIVRAEQTVQSRNEICFLSHIKFSIQTAPCEKAALNVSKKVSFVHSTNLHTRKMCYYIIDINGYSMMVATVYDMSKRYYHRGQFYFCFNKNDIRQS